MKEMVEATREEYNRPHGIGTKRESINFAVVPKNERRETANHITRDSRIIGSTTKEEKLNDSEDMEDISATLMRYCSRFQSCDAPKCPLDPLIDSRLNLEGNDICTLSKNVRHGYYQSMPEEMKSLLPYQGYFRSEFNRINSAKKRWNSLSDSERAIIIDNGRRALALRRNEK